MKYMVLAFCILAAACTNNTATSVPGGIEVSNGFGSAGVQEITLPDGTKCAVLIGYYKGAISCGWLESMNAQESK